MLPVWNVSNAYTSFINCVVTPKLYETFAVVS